MKKMNTALAVLGGAILGGLVVGLILYSFVRAPVIEDLDEPSFGSPPPPTEEMRSEQQSAFGKLGAARDATADQKPIDEDK